MTTVAITLYALVVVAALIGIVAGLAMCALWVRTPHDGTREALIGSC